METVQLLIFTLGNNFLSGNRTRGKTARRVPRQPIPVVILRSRCGGFLPRRTIENEHVAFPLVHFGMAVAEREAARVLVPRRGIVNLLRLRLHDLQARIINAIRVFIQIDPDI